jgi:hypothetical protein
MSILAVAPLRVRAGHRVLTPARGALDREVTPSGARRARCAPTQLARAPRSFAAPDRAGQRLTTAPHHSA